MVFHVRETTQNYRIITGKWCFTFWWEVGVKNNLFSDTILSVHFLGLELIENLFKRPQILKCSILMTGKQSIVFAWVFFFSNLFSSEAFLFNHPIEKIKMTKLAHILALWSDQKYSVKVRISQCSTDLLPQACF